MPYYFNIFRDKIDSDHKYVFTDGDSCDLWEVNLKSAKCKIVVRDPENNEVYTKDNIDCLTGEDWHMDESLIGKWAKAQYDLYHIDINSTTRWRYWPTIDYVQTKIDSNWESSENLWEYKLYVYLYQFDRCDENWTWKQQKYWEDGLLEQAPGCQSNFILTKPYTVQKTPSGNLTASTKTLWDFKQVDGSEIKPFSRYLNAIATSEYTPNQKVNDAMDAFIKKYEKLAVSIKKDDTEMKKVPWKNIYFIDWDFTINGWNFDTAFTFVQTNPNSTITIKWNSNLNMMILTKWNIAFKWSCTDNQNVKWIFYAKWNLVRTWVLHNDHLTNNVWCTKWWLNIKWVLIWNNFNDLMKHSRSHLETWFKSDGSRDGDETQLGRKIMNGWSVVIEYSPSIFTKGSMPPGAEDFTTALSIYKQ